MERVAVIEEPDRLRALAHPLRAAILSALRSADSAAGVARRLGETRQKVNYHLKELAAAGLAEAAGERRAGNFVEQLYVASASTYVVSPRTTWLGSGRADALAAQLSLEHLVGLGERLQVDAAALLDRAVFDGDEISSCVIDAEVRFADDAARSDFMEEYLALLGPLLQRYGSSDGEPFRVSAAAYPNPS